MNGKFWKTTGLGAGAAAILLGGYLGALQLTGNFHEVLPGVLYRSAQPSAADIAAYSREYGIRTIVNLRGESENSDWYRQEIAAAQQAGIEHIDFRMSASKQLTLDRTRQLIALLREAPKPILIHCQAGADRSGLASVIFLQQIAGIDEETAERQLSILYGHIGIPYLSSSFAMDENWEALEKAFGLPS
jgi:protein tyrosine/serine phosphatase